MGEHEYIVVFSDVHGNLKNFTLFREGMRGFKYNSVYCLGDLVQNGLDFDENRTIEEVRKTKPHCVRGNHDEDLPDKPPKILQPNLQFLLRLERHIVERDMLFFHSSMIENGRRLDNVRVIEEEAKHIRNTFPDIKYVFFGHTHMQGIYSYDTQKRKLTRLELSKPTKFEEGNIYLTNPGTLGLSATQENNFAVFDQREKTCRIITLPYLQEMSTIRYILLKFEEEWMPHLKGDTWSWRSIDDEISQLEHPSQNHIFQDVLKVMRDFNQDVQRKQKKGYYSDFSLKLANELEKLATPEVMSYYDVRSPLETRDFYLSLRKTNKYGVTCISPLRVIK